jgi:hypothetical protein
MDYARVPFFYPNPAPPPKANHNPVFVLAKLTRTIDDFWRPKLMRFAKRDRASNSIFISAAKNASKVAEFVCVCVHFGTAACDGVNIVVLSLFIS